MEFLFEYSRIVRRRNEFPAGRTLARVTRIPIIAPINFYATPDKPSCRLAEQTSALIVTASARLRVRSVRLLLALETIKLSREDC